jgi:hypothetical protein
VRISGRVQPIRRERASVLGKRNQRGFRDHRREAQRETEIEWWQRV